MLVKFELLIVYNVNILNFIWLIKGFVYTSFVVYGAHFIQTFRQLPQYLVIKFCILSPDIVTEFIFMVCISIDVSTLVRQAIQVYMDLWGPFCLCDLFSVQNKNSPLIFNKRAKLVKMINIYLEESLCMHGSSCFTSVTHCKDNCSSTNAQYRQPGT